MNYGSYVEDSYRFTSEKLESVSHILLISVKVLEVLLQQKDGIGIWENFIRNMLSNYRVSQKNACSWLFVYNSKGLGTKVGCVLKNSGNFLSERLKFFNLTY